jgi:hypothetical protein
MEVEFHAFIILSLDSSFMLRSLYPQYLLDSWIFFADLGMIKVKS